MITLTFSHLARKTSGDILQLLWVVLNQMDMDFMIWRGMVSGLVSQWDYYLVSPTNHPNGGPETGNTKVTRGGYWYSWDEGLHVYNRGDNPPDVNIGRMCKGVSLCERFKIEDERITDKP